MFIKIVLKILKIAPLPLLLSFPLAVLAYRMELWGMGTSFKLIQFSAIFSAVLLILAIIIGIISFIKKQQDAIKVCIVAGVLLAVPVIGLSMQALKAKSLPFIHQVATDTTNLPEFNVVIGLRGDSSNPLAYDHATLAPLQQEFYPELQPILSELNTEQAFTQAVNTAMALGWKVVAKNKQQGIVEAVDSTLIWGFKDDVVIRIQQTQAGSKIDLRSISRIGGSDLGANAARIKRFIDAF